MRLLQEFKEFAVKGNVVDMAVGIILGVAFTTVVTSVSADLLTPPIGLLVGDEDLSDRHWVLREGDPAGPYSDPAVAKEAGAVTMNYGRFLDTLTAFTITAFALFLVVRAMNRLRRREEDPAQPSAPTRRNCPWCTSSIPVAARRCPECTSEVTPVGAPDAAATGARDGGAS